MTTIKKIKDILEKVNGKNIKAYDFEQTSPFYDYFVVATVNERQANAAANNIKKDDELGKNLKHVEGKDTGWVLVDLGNIIVHLFSEEDRKTYDFDTKLMGIKQVG